MTKLSKRALHSMRSKLVVQLKRDLTRVSPQWLCDVESAIGYSSVRSDLTADEDKAAIIAIAGVVRLEFLVDAVHSAAFHADKADERAADLVLGRISPELLRDFIRRYPRYASVEEENKAERAVLSQLAQEAAP